MTMDWSRELRDQLSWHVEQHVWPRLAGLTDEEYFWEPVPGCWSIRPRAEATSPMAAGGGLPLAAGGGPPFAALVLHIHREAIHHLAEVLVLRDLYRQRDQAAPP